MEVATIRTALLITLSILLIVVVLRRFRRNVVANDLPVPLHVELLALKLAYHPERLLIELHLPTRQEVHLALLDDAHRPIHEWQAESLPAGTARLDRALPPLDAGLYHLEMATSTQRTVRQFRLQR